MASSIDANANKNSPCRFAAANIAFIDGSLRGGSFRDVFCLLGVAGASWGLSITHKYFAKAIMVMPICPPKGLPIWGNSPRAIRSRIAFDVAVSSRAMSSTYRMLAVG